MKVRLGWLNNPVLHMAMVVAALVLGRALVAPAVAAIQRMAAAKSAGHRRDCPPDCAICKSTPADAPKARDDLLLRMGAMDPAE